MQRSIHSRILNTGILLLALAIVGRSAAGHSDNPSHPPGQGDIVIGQSADLSGQFAPISQQFLTGANVYFAQLNAQGGIRGRKLRLLSADDKGDPELAVRNTVQFLQNAGAVALFGYTGAQTSMAVQPIVNQRKVLFFAPITGNRAVYSTANRHIFTIRASYVNEYEYLFSRLPRIGLKRLAIFDDGTGPQQIAFIKTLIVNAKAQLVASESGIGQDIDKIADKLLQARPDVILIMSVTQKLNVALIKSLHAKAYLGYLYCNSLICSPLLTNNLEDTANGLIISQIVPFPWRAATPIVHEYQHAMLKAGIKKFSYLGLEGFIAAKVLAEGMRRAGPNMTREKLIAAMEGINQTNYKLAGFRINYSATNHHGSTYVDTTTIDKHGTIVH
ncbi:ABC transporter substrate-binding protein [Herbaspirillum rhizosphaerae]|uniref:ABC transporter substrate-binding protein n=1 Tax=Herbaspirillum rhizosphaerae TaxID=346179 RepID=UPI0012EE33D3|nr:ABC transporter substrate-binding protein [Herbaspirillum rhizosphaerae]